jgi:hypothetical protein
MNPQIHLRRISLYNDLDKILSGTKVVLLYRRVIFLLLYWQPRILALMREVASN